MPARLTAAAGLVIVAIGAIAPASPAFAHGGLAVSTPANGGTLSAPADSVSLAFTEKPAPFAYFTVTAPTGVRVDRPPWSHSEPVRLNDPVREYNLVNGVWQPQEFHTGFPVKVPVAHWPQQGLYIVRYQSIATDGEPVKGEIRFTYSGPMTPAPGGWRPPTDQPSPQLLDAAGHPPQVQPAASIGAQAAPAAPPSGDDRTWLWLGPVLVLLAVIVVVAVRGTKARK
jgi:methionine-rich copper-binding protein CopC